MNVKTLYKKDSKGKLRVWKITAEGPDIIETYGLADGELTESRKTCHAKNVGRSNETTPEEQANSEMLSKITEKLKEDYFETADEAMNSVVLLPMLAKDYKKESKKVVFPCYAQPKLDGMRCLNHINDAPTLISRSNSIIDTLQHIEKATSHLEKGTTLDGELYAHGLSFQENMKLIKKYRAGETEKVMHHVYDMVSDEPFIKRYNKLSEIVKGIPEIQMVPTVVINDEKELKQMHAQFLAAGYEGTIVRWGDAGYKLNGRSSNLLKYKDFKDMDCKIIDVIPMDARPEHGMVVCTCDAGEFKATPKFSHEERAEILANKDNYIGQTAEIRYFEETDDGLPRFPVCVGFRLDK